MTKTYCGPAIVEFLKGVTRAGLVAKAAVPSNARPNPGPRVRFSTRRSQRFSQRSNHCVLCVKKFWSMPESEFDLGAGEELQGVAAVLALEVHVVGGIGLQRHGAVEEVGDIADFEIGFGRLV